MKEVKEAAQTAAAQHPEDQALQLSAGQQPWILKTLQAAVNILEGKTPSVSSRGPASRIKEAAVLLAEAAVAPK